MTKHKELLQEMRSLEFVNSIGQEKLLIEEPLAKADRDNVIAWAAEMFSSPVDFIKDFKASAEYAQKAQGFLPSVLPTEFSSVSHTGGHEEKEDLAAQYPRLAQMYERLQHMLALEGMLEKGIRPQGALIRDAEEVLEFTAEYKKIAELKLTDYEQRMQKLPPLKDLPAEVRFARMMQNLVPGSAKSQYEDDMGDLSFLNALADFTLKACKELGVQRPRSP